MSNPSAHDLLHDIFGYSAFRGPQQAIVEHVAQGGDALVLMPTGVGFYYVNNSVSYRSVYIAFVDDDFCQPTKTRQRNAFQLTSEFTGIPSIFDFATRIGCKLHTWYDFVPSCRVKNLLAHVYCLFLPSSLSN